MTTYFYTIGYEGRSILDFISVLRANDIEEVIDVRELPLSRKPGFSKSSLCQQLAEAGIHYQSAKTLGSPKELRHHYQSSGDFESFSEKFNKVLFDKKDDIANVIEEANKRRVCLLCFERDPKRCHRSIISRAIMSASHYNLTVLNI